MSLGGRSRGAARGRPIPAGLIAVILALIVVPGIFFASWLARRPRAIADNRAWTVAGQPCSPLTAAAFAALGPPKPEQVFNYGDGTFARKFGGVACNWIVNDGGRGFGKYAVCQFSSPDTLVVQAPDGLHYFHPGLSPATVSLPHNKVQCVLGAHFTPGHWPEESPG